MSKILYRSEYFEGSGERNATSIMAYETFELENAGIYDAVSNIISGPILDALGAAMNEPYGSRTEDEYRSLMQDCLYEIEKTTGKCVKYALWLAKKEDAYKYHLAGTVDISYMDKDSPSVVPNDVDLDAYEISDDAVCLSDLGDEGFLYGFLEYPKPI